MSFCQNCGRSLPENSSVCPICPSPAPAAAAVAAVPAPAASGLQPQTAAALAYLAGFVTGIIFLVIDPFKADRFVRFHAFQSIFFNLVWIVGWFASIPLGMLLPYGFSALLSMVSLLLSLGGILVWLLLMWKAYQGQPLSLPVIGGIAQQQAGK